MPKRKAIIIPDWLGSVMRDNRVEGSVYQNMPWILHWRELDKVLAAVQDSTASEAVREQTVTAIANIKAQMTIEKNNPNDVYSLVAHVSFPRNIPFTMIFSIAENVKRPAREDHLVFRLYRNGVLKDIERVYHTESGSKRNT